MLFYCCQSLATLLCEMRDVNKSLQFEVDDLKQKLSDANGDIKVCYVLVFVVLLKIVWFNIFEPEWLIWFHVSMTMVSILGKRKYLHTNVD